MRQRETDNEEFVVLVSTEVVRWINGEGGNVDGEGVVLGISELDVYVSKQNGR